MGSSLGKAHRKEAQQAQNIEHYEHAGDYYYMKASACAKSGDNIKAMELYSKAAIEYEKSGNIVKSREMYLNATIEYEAGGSGDLATEMRSKAASLHRS